MNRSLSFGPRVGKALPRTFDPGVVALSCDATRRAAMRCVELRSEADDALRSIENGKARRSGPACASDTVQQAREGRSLATEAETVL